MTLPFGKRAQFGSLRFSSFLHAFLCKTCREQRETERAMRKQKERKIRTSLWLVKSRGPTEESSCAKREEKEHFLCCFSRSIDCKHICKPGQWKPRGSLLQCVRERREHCVFHFTSVPCAASPGPARPRTWPSSAASTPAAISERKKKSLARLPLKVTTRISILKKSSAPSCSNPLRASLWQQLLLRLLLLLLLLRRRRRRLPPTAAALLHRKFFFFSFPFWKRKIPQAAKFGRKEVVSGCFSDCKCFKYGLFFFFFLLSFLLCPRSLPSNIEAVEAVPKPCKVALGLSRTWQSAYLPRSLRKSSHFSTAAMRKKLLLAISSLCKLFTVE